MKSIRMTGYEIKRLLRVRRTWLFLAFFILTPIICVTDWFGLASNYSGGMSTVLMLLPAKSAVFAGAIAGLLFALLELQHATGTGVSTIVESISKPLGNYVRQTVATLAVTLLGFLAAMLFVLPYTMITMGEVFRVLPFVGCWVILYLGGIVTILLLSAGIYMITCSFDISFLLVALLILTSFAIDKSTQSLNYLFFWLQTNVAAFSDASRSQLQVDVIAFVRAVWLCAALTVYCLGLCAIRRYSKGLWGSLLYSVKKTALPVVTLFLTAAMVFMLVGEPFIDNGPLLQHRQSVDPETGIVVYETVGESFTLDEGAYTNARILEASAEIRIDTVRRRLYGDASYNIETKDGGAQPISLEISPGLEIKSAELDGKPVEFRKNDRDNFMRSMYYFDLPGSGYLTIRYEGAPRNDRGNGPQQRMTGITKEFVFIHYPVPQMKLSIITDCTLHLPEEIIPLIAEVELQELPQQLEGYRSYAYQTFGYDWLFAGDYIVEAIPAGGMEVQFAYLAGREKAMKESGAAELVADVINFFTDTFGPLDWQGQPMVIGELDGSFVGGGWGLGNMSVFGESWFMGVVYKGDGSNQEGGSGIGLAVHEIAHQWWGWFQDSVWIEEESNSPWSSEGLAVYSTYLYMRHRFGEEFANREFAEQWEHNTLMMQNAFYLNHLEYAANLPENEAAAIYSAFSAATRYDLMPMLLLKVRDMVGGEEVFHQKLRDIRKEYKGQPLSYNNFLQELGLERGEITLE